MHAEFINTWLCFKMLLSLLLALVSPRVQA
jgi:hypothetical protein